MALSFPRPAFSYSIDLAAERQRIRAHRRLRGVPARRKEHLLLATWNIANLGTQDRAPEAVALLAEILNAFDLVALQETRRDLSGLRAILAHLDKRWAFVCTDAAGNQERMVVLYDRNKLRLREQIAEVAIPPAQHRFIKLREVGSTFRGLDRHPQVVSFLWGETPLTLGNVHLFFGSTSKADVERRQLEAYAVARWARLENRSPHAFDPHVILLGDFNLPYMRPEDPILGVLAREGLVLAPYATEIGTTLPSEPRGNTAVRVNHYDQIAFFPDMREHFTGGTGVFDFDTVILPDLWHARGRKDFNAYLRYHFSDHRLLWTQIQAPPRG
jgi:endonuclease/exonuclease/phosphatase family metal-dependent hydrolase